MAVPSWPSALPYCPLRDGYSRGFADGRQFQRMEQGPPKSRRRYSSAVKPVNVTFHLNPDQAATLEGFWERTTDQGALPFTMRVPFEDGRQLMTSGGGVIMAGSVPLRISSVWLVMFAEGAPEIVPAGSIRFQASFSLSVMP